MWVQRPKHLDHCVLDLRRSSWDVHFSSDTGHQHHKLWLNVLGHNTGPHIE